MPPHSLRAELLYKHASGFYAAPSVEWMPKSFYADNANTLDVAPCALLTVKVGFDPGSGVSGYLEGRNPLDRRSITSTITADTADASIALFNPGDGRNGARTDRRREGAGVEARAGSLAANADCRL